MARVLRKHQELPIPFLFGEFLAPFSSEYESRLFYIWGKQASFGICVRIVITKEWKRCEKCRLLFGELTNTKRKIESGCVFFVVFEEYTEFPCILAFSWQPARKHAFSSEIIPNQTNGKSLTCWRLKFNIEVGTWCVCMCVQACACMGTWVCALALVVGQGGG